MKTSFKLGDITQVRQGFTFKESIQGKQDLRWNYYKVADIGLASNGKYLTRALNSIDAEALEAMGVTPFPKGSIVFPRVGAALRNNNKKILAEDSLTDDNVIVVTISNPEVVLSEYLYYWFLTIDLSRLCNDGLVPVINGGTIKRQIVFLPSIPEQRAIADTLSTWDTAIEKMERLIAAKEMLLALARERAFHKSTNSMLVRVGDVTRESDARNNGRLDRDKVMAVTKSVGMRPMREETIASSLDRYKIVRPGGFAYNPMRLNIGSIAKSGFESDVLVSPDYVVFECLESRMLPGLLEHLRQAHRWSTHFEVAGSGGVRVRIHYDELARFEFWLPDLRQQVSVLGRLDLVAKEIRLLKGQIALLRRQKRGLMQKLLTGAWRVPVPKGTP